MKKLLLLLSLISCLSARASDDDLVAFVDGSLFFSNQVNLASATLKLEVEEIGGTPVATNLNISGASLKFTSRELTLENLAGIENAIRFKDKTTSSDDGSSIYEYSDGVVVGRVWLLRDGTLRYNGAGGQSLFHVTGGLGNLFALGDGLFYGNIYGSNITSSTLTASSLIASDADNKLVSVTVGSGLNFAAGTLTATGGGVATSGGVATNLTVKGALNSTNDTTHNYVTIQDGNFRATGDAMLVNGSIIFTNSTLGVSVAASIQTDSTTFTNLYFPMVAAGTLQLGAMHVSRFASDGSLFVGAGASITVGDGNFYADVTSVKFQPGSGNSAADFYEESDGVFPLANFRNNGGDVLSKVNNRGSFIPPYYLKADRPDPPDDWETIIVYDGSDNYMSYYDPAVGWMRVTATADP